MNFLSEIERRGMLQEATPDLDMLLATKPVKGYIGFDPTAPSLHIGNLATLVLLEHLQRAGHRPVVLLGGATGMIGDPSFKQQERRFLDEEKLRYHQACIADQLKQFFDFSANRGAILVNNYDWYKEMNVLSFLRDAGKKISVNYMMGKESVKRRLVDGISYTEFAYQLLQGYDYYYLNKHHGVQLQMGGADQWGNMTTGIELVRKKSGEQVHALTTPLMTKADGSKFGKSEEGNIWLDAKMTSPYAFYQFWMNCDDVETPMLLKRMTFHDVAEIDSWVADHAKAPEKRILQRALAKNLTTKLHGVDTYTQVVKASDVLFGSASPTLLWELPPSLLDDIFAQLPQAEITNSQLESIHSLTDLLTIGTGYTLLASKRSAREMILAGSIRLNKTKENDPDTLPAFKWLADRYLLLQKGKKGYFVLKKKVG